MTFVNMERIEKHFNNNVVLKDVSLQMNRGEIVSIIGPSGSGKSTFLRCLGQLETIDGGAITVDGVELASTDTNGVVKICSINKLCTIYYFAWAWYFNPSIYFHI